MKTKAIKAVALTMLFAASFAVAAVQSTQEDVKVENKVDKRKIKVPQNG